MSTPQSIPHPGPRYRIRPGTLLTALGFLLAIAVTIIVLALTSANHTTLATPVTASQAAGSSTPQTQYLGPHYERTVRPRPISTGLPRVSPLLQTRPISRPSGGITPATSAGNPAAHYNCLGAARSCLR
jgi:hypothetical protein